MLLNFDFDGVFVDSLHILFQTIKDAQKEINIGRIPVIQDLTEIDNLTFERVAEIIGIPGHLNSTFVGLVYSLQKNRLQYARLFPEFAPTIKELSIDNTIVIVTSSDSGAVWENLKNNGIDTAIDAVLGGELHLSKADRILRAQQIYSYLSSETFMVGDSASDIYQGKLAKVNTIAVTWGFQSNYLLLKQNPDFIIDQPDELLNVVQYYRESIAV